MKKSGNWLCVRCESIQQKQTIFLSARMAFTAPNSSFVLHTRLHFHFGFLIALQLTMAKPLFTKARQWLSLVSISMHLGECRKPKILSDLCVGSDGSRGNVFLFIVIFVVNDALCRPNAMGKCVSSLRSIDWLVFDFISVYRSFGAM